LPAVWSLPEPEERWEKLHEAIRAAAVPLKMGKLWMTGPQARAAGLE